ncbi:MAG: crossover junction endodeoxyribonuclease RuvC [Bdellovibrionota bacterium]
MRIIGIDPGTRIAGYGVIDCKPHSNPVPVAAGAWKLETVCDDKKKSSLPARLGTLAVEFRRVLDVYKPTHLCLELSFLADNPRTALFLGHSRGVILSEAYQYKLVITEISATSAKKMISGNGRADKSAIAKIMSQLLGFSMEKLPFDATDALAIAYADALRYKLNGCLEMR